MKFRKKKITFASYQATTPDDRLITGCAWIHLPAKTYTDVEKVRQRIKANDGFKEVVIFFFKEIEDDE